MLCVDRGCEHKMCRIQRNKSKIRKFATFAACPQLFAKFATNLLDSIGTKWGGGLDFAADARSANGGEVSKTCRR